MAMHNLSDDVSKSFTFAVDGLEFEFRRPLVSELKANQSLQEKLSAATTAEEKQKLSNELMNFMYGLITPINHDKSIENVLDDQPVNVMQNFNKMVEQELSLQ